MVTNKTINAKACCDNCMMLFIGTDWVVCEVRSLSKTSHNANRTAVVAALALETLGKIYPGLDIALSYHNLFG